MASTSFISSCLAHNKRVVAKVNKIYPNSLFFFEEVLDEGTEKDIIVELDKRYLRRKRYEGDHWDDVIRKYKEMELREKISFRLKNDHDIITAMEAKICENLEQKVSFLVPHVIDLDAEGYICKFHVNMKVAIAI